MRNKSALKKISGTVLLSHSRIYSTIAAGVLNYRVREGNVCCYPAMSTGKKHNKEKSCRESEEVRRTPVESLDFFLKAPCEALRKKVVKPHG